MKFLYLIIGLFLSLSVEAYDSPADKPLSWQGKCYSCTEEKILENHYPQKGYISNKDDVCEEVCKNRILYGFSWIGEGSTFCAIDSFKNRLSAMYWKHIPDLILPPMWLFYFFCFFVICKFVYKLLLLKIKNKIFSKILSFLLFAIIVLFWGIVAAGKYFIAGLFITTIISLILTKIFFKEQKKDKQKEKTTKVGKIVSWMLVIALLTLLLYNILSFLK